MTIKASNEMFDQMAAHGDHPIIDSKFLTNKDGSKAEIGYGGKGTYYASNATGEWERYADFFRQGA